MDGFGKWDIALHIDWVSRFLSLVFSDFVLDWTRGFPRILDIISFICFSPSFSWVSSILAILADQGRPG